RHRHWMWGSNEVLSASRDLPVCHLRYQAVTMYVNATARRSASDFLGLLRTLMKFVRLFRILCSFDARSWSLVLISFGCGCTSTRRNVEEGGSCLRSLECAPGLACVTGRCSSD